MAASRILLVSVLMAAECVAQDEALERVKTESARQNSLTTQDFWKKSEAFRERSAAFHAAIRDWIETQLPKSKAVLDAEFPYLSPKLNAVQQAGLIAPRDNVFDGPANFGSIDHVRTSRPPGDPDRLLVNVGIDVPCGFDDAVYVYDYSQGSPRRILASRGARDHGEIVSDVLFSKLDESGSRLILILRSGVQCGSTWNMLAYDLFRLSAGAPEAVPILSGEHGIWFGAEHPYQVRLELNDLLMEIRDRSIDPVIHNRAHILHYKVEDTAVTRIDPVALQPQDFVDEWLNQPWEVMESRSAAAEDGKLKLWHEFLSGDFVGGEFSLVQACSNEPGQWQVGVDMSFIRGKQLPDPLPVYFLVQQLGQYQFKMTGISFDPEVSCPGESEPNENSPSLFPVHEN
jgi:hypothetical protein